MYDKIKTEQINRLRGLIGEKMSGFRLEHTLGVERMAVRLGELMAPEHVDLLRAAALLHDVTKELTLPEQVEICERFGVTLTKEELAAPATLHSITASLIIPEQYPEFALEELLAAVRYHTTGRESMSLCEKIIYLADYIDETRKYDDCIALREEFFSAEPEKMTQKERLEHLDRVILRSFDLTVADLLEKGRVISPETVKARNSVIFELANMKNHNGGDKNGRD